MLLLFLWKPFAQVILRCERQTDCIVGNYCNSDNQCNTCEDITTTYCDSLNGCCNTPFRFQCRTSSFVCPTYQRETTGGINGLHLFLYLFIVLTIAYLFTGCYYNMSINQRSGWDIIPHRRYWVSLFSLVEDGIYFTYSTIRRKINTRYTSLE